jgi:DNA-directed RNA polymerase specialized sigma24 family protein
MPSRAPQSPAGVAGRSGPDPTPTPPPSTAGASYLLRLVRRIADKDPDAFADLSDIVSEAILLKVQSSTRDPAGATAIAAATLVEVWSMARFHCAAGADVDTWLSQIVARRAADRDASAGWSLERSDVAGYQPGRAAIAENDRQMVLTLADLQVHPLRPTGYW